MKETNGVNARVKLGVSMPWAQWVVFVFTSKISLLRNQVVESCGFDLLQRPPAQKAGDRHRSVWSWSVQIDFSRAAALDFSKCGASQLLGHATAQVHNHGVKTVREPSPKCFHASILGPFLWRVIPSVELCLKNLIADLCQASDVSGSLSPFASK